MIRRPAPLIALSILATLLAATFAPCQTTGGNQRTLVQLTEATRAQLPGRASKLSGSVGREIESDLIFYRWASEASEMPTDVKNIDAVITALSKSLRDPVTTWALTLFSDARPSSLVPEDDGRVGLLTDLKREYTAALGYRESSPLLAAKSLQAALEICKKLQMELSQALILKGLGDHYFNMTRYHEAEDCYSNAAWTFSLYDCVESNARVYADYGALNGAMGRYPASAENYKTAAQQWVSLSEKAPASSRYREQAGREYMRAGDAEVAAGETDKALELMSHGLDYLRNAAFATKTYADFIANLMNVAQVYRARGNTTKALDLLEEAKNDLKMERNPMLSAKVYGEISDTYAAANQTVESRNAARLRGKALDEAIIDGNTAMAELNNEQSLPGAARADIGRVERAAAASQELKDYTRSADTWRKLVDVCKRAELTEKRVSSLRSLAGVLDLQGKSTESLQARLEAVTTARKMNKKALAADTGREMVQALIQSGDLNNALEVFKDLVSIFEEAGNVRGAAEALAGRGKLLARDGRYRATSQDAEGAKVKFQAALLDLQDARQEYLEKVGDPWAAGETSRELAEVQVALNKLPEARGTLEDALKEIEGITENIDPSANEEHSRIMMNLYRALASIYIIGHDEDKATLLLRKSKRYPWITALLDSLKSDTDPTVARFATEFDLVRTTTSSNPADAPSTDRLLADNWAAFWKTCVMLKQQHTTGYNALPVDPLEMLQRRLFLPKDGVVIEYMPAGNSMYVFVCGYDKSICREIAIRNGDLSGFVSSLRKALKGNEERMSTGIGVPGINDWREAEFLEIKQPLVGLYSKLIAPIRQDIEERKLLMFALPDEFSGLPIHALISSGADSDAPRFLIEDYRIAYLGNGMLDSLVGTSSRAIDPSSDKLAIFADPEGNLPGARSEATALMGAYYLNQPYIGNKATVESFRKECERSGILHIAAHYKIDPNPGKFVLQLAPTGDSDGMVGIEELSEMANPHLGLVVLSACDSLASSDPISSGPSRAAEVFTLAGAKSVLGGLWKVSDEAASKIMVRFYRSLSKGESRAESLRLAQIDVIKSKDYAHPFYWACFALYGNPR